MKKEIAESKLEYMGSGFSKWLTRSFEEVWKQELGATALTQQLVIRGKLSATVEVEPSFHGK